MVILSLECGPSSVRDKVVPARRPGHGRRVSGR
jgi:hypothetical protein